MLFLYYQPYHIRYSPSIHAMMALGLGKIMNVIVKLSWTWSRKESLFLFLMMMICNIRLSSTNNEVDSINVSLHNPFPVILWPLLQLQFQPAWPVRAHFVCVHTCITLETVVFVYSLMTVDDAVSLYRYRNLSSSFALWLWSLRIMLTIFQEFMTCSPRSLCMRSTAYKSLNLSSEDN